MASSLKTMASQHKQTARRIWPIWNNFTLSIASVSLLICVLGCPAEVEGQFFTKSSKSIPRMGRRSQFAPLDAAQSRRSLVDSLLEEMSQQSQQLIPKTNEIASLNEQPADERQLELGDPSGRSTSPKTQGASSWDSGLATRALQTHKLLQYLTSGRPLVPFEKLLLTNEQPSSTGSNAIY